jgi:hypothetical protein
MYDSFQEPLDAGINDKGSCEGGGCDRSGQRTTPTTLHEPWSEP